MFMPKPGDFMKELMGANVKKDLKSCGKNVMIYPMAKIVSPHLVEIGDYSRLCDYAFIHPGNGVKIGKYTDFQHFSSIWGGGEVIIGDFVNIGPGVQLLSATYKYQEGSFMTSVVPSELQNIDYGNIVIKDHAYIGANCTIMLNVCINEGAVVGANSFVNKDLEPWSIYIGSPARKVGERPKDVLEKVKLHNL